MSVYLIITILMVAMAGSFLSGMLGIGGAIVNYPLLLFIPKALGFEGFTAHEVSGIVAVQVFFSTLTGVLSYRKDGYLKKDLILTMGISILVASFIGGYSSRLLTEDAINIVYGILALLAVVLMLIPNRENETALTEENLEYNRLLAVFFSIFIGLGAGIVGAGGAFLLVPVMITVLKIPTRVTIATSLGVTFISSIGTTSGKLLTGDILLLPAIIVIIASIVASPVGARVSARINTKHLRTILALLILMTAFKIWVDILY